MIVPFRIVNVFTVPGDPFSGNPLAVFEPPGRLPTEVMQALARQMNLSETTFVRRGGPDADAAVRIFTPSVEFPFAGHPTIGTAAVLGADLGRDAVTLALRVGPIPVERVDDRWVLTARPATVAVADLDRATLGSLLGLPADAVAGAGCWVDSGLPQLLVQVRDPAAVRACVPDCGALLRHTDRGTGEALCYAWAWDGPDRVEARLFFSVGAALAEDPATGSAAANLGGLLVHQGRRGLRVTIAQGAAVRRPSLLHLEVTAGGVVRVGGSVQVLGSGSVDLR